MDRVGNEWVLFDTHLNFLAIATPQTPPANQLKLYAKEVTGVSTLCYKNDAGVEICLTGSSGGTVSDTPAGTAGQVAYFTAAHTITSDAHFLWDATNQKLSVIGKSGTGDIVFIQGVSNDVLHISEDTGNSAAILKIGKSAQTNAYITTDESMIIIIDANNDQTSRTFSIGHDGAPGSQVGLLSINESGDFQVNTTDTALPRGITNIQLTNDGNASGIQLIKTRATTGGSHVAVQTDDALGELNFFGDDGAAFQRTALIQGKASENWTGSARGSYMRFFVTPSTTTTLTLAMRILNNSQLEYSNSGNNVTGGGSASLGANSPAVTNTAPYTWFKVTTSDGSQGYIPVWK